jgi:hypothetical protein
MKTLFRIILWVLLVPRLIGQSICIPSITAPVNFQCEVLLTAAEVLIEIPTGLNGSDFNIIIENYTGPGIYTYSVSLKSGIHHSFNGCKGQINIVDLKPPTLSAPENTAYRWEKIRANALQGEITLGHSKKLPVQMNCFTAALFANPIPFDSIYFSVPEDGFYSFFLLSEFEPIGILSKLSSFESCLFGIDGSDIIPKPYDLKPGPDLLALAQNSWIQPNDSFSLRLSGYLKKNESYLLSTYAKSTTSIGKFVWIVITEKANFSSDTLILKNNHQVIPAEDRWMPIPIFQTDKIQFHSTQTYIVAPNGQFLQGDSGLINTIRKTGFPHLFSETFHTPSPNILGDFNYYGAIRDSCGPIEINIIDQWFENGDCNGAYLERKFWAKDPSGHLSDIEKQLIIFRNPGITELNMPPLVTTIICGEDTSPSRTGSPYLWSEKGRIAYEMSGYTDLSTSQLCGGSYSFLRRWTIYDWCNPSKSSIFNQIIQVLDTTAPLIHISNYIEIATHPLYCQAEWEFPNPDSLYDECSSAFVRKIEQKSTGKTFMPGDKLLLDTGVFIFTYIAEDECGHSTSKDITLNIIDHTIPHISCDPIRHVSLGYLEANRIAEGAFDNCQPIELRIRKWLTDTCAIQSYLNEKHYSGSIENAASSGWLFPHPHYGYYSQWEEKIGMDCCDATSGNVEIELKATEKNSGLSNTCRTLFMVEDKQPVFCIAPPDIELTCGSSPLYEDIPDVIFQCNYSMTELPSITDLNHCGTGTVLRRFVVLNSTGNMPDTCQQRITIKPFHRYRIQFPEDLRIEDCIDFEAPKPTWISEGCDLITHSVDTMVFYTKSEACFEFKTRHRILNWCEFVDGDNPIQIPSGKNIVVIRDSTGAYINNNGILNLLEQSGFYEYKHTIRVQDKVPPIISHPTYPPVCAYESCLVKMQLPFIVQDECDNGGVSFEFFYDENSDGIYDDIFQLFSEDDIRDSLFGIFGRAPKLTLISFFPVGKHQLIVNAQDGCGNKSSKAIPFEVLDCKPPSPTCIDGLAVELAPIAGSGLVETTDFLVNIPDDCVGPVEFSIHRLEELPRKGKTSLTLSCADLGLLKVKIVAWDQAFNPFALQPDSTQGGPNYSFCITTVHVQDNLYPLCHTSMQGFVKSETNIGLKGVQVFLENETQRNTITNDVGFFEIHGEGKLLAKYDGPFLSGISTFDLVLISRHILGTESFKTKYQFIAADVNGSGSVTTMDMIELRKIILGITDYFSAVPSWQMIKAPVGNDFIAVKTGDVNHSAFETGMVLGRENIKINVEDKNYNQHQPVSVKIDLSQLNAYAAGQLGIHFDHQLLEFTHLESSFLNSSHWNLDREGVIRLLWTEEEWKSTTINAHIVLHFFSQSPSKLSESVYFNQGKFNSMALGKDGEIFPLELTWTSSPNHISLYPNPFTEFFHIELPDISASRVRLEIFNLVGVKVFEKEFNSIEGIKINRDQLSGTGTYLGVMHLEDKEILSFKILHKYD